MLRHKPVEPTIYQNDGYNCGIIAFVNCLEKYTNSKRVHRLSQQKQDKFMMDMGLKILSIASDLWMIFNGDKLTSLKIICLWNMEKLQIDKI